MLKMIGQYGLPLVLSVVLLGFILTNITQSNENQGTILAEVSKQHDRIATTLDRINARLDYLDGKQSATGSPSAPLR